MAVKRNNPNLLNIDIEIFLYLPVIYFFYQKDRKKIKNIVFYGTIVSNLNLSFKLIEEFCEFTDLDFVFCGDGYNFANQIVNEDL